MIFNPKLRADPAPHIYMNGLVLRLRHPGFGWLPFLISHEEANGLGTWLVNNARPHPVSAADPEQEEQIEK